MIHSFSAQKCIPFPLSSLFQVSKQDSKSTTADQSLSIDFHKALAKPQVSMNKLKLIESPCLHKWWSRSKASFNLTVGDRPLMKEHMSKKADFEERDLKQPAVLRKHHLITSVLWS